MLNFKTLQMISVNTSTNPWANRGFWKAGSVWHWTQILKLLLNTAFPCVVNKRDRYHRTENQLDIEGWKVETLSLQKVKSWNTFGLVGWSCKVLSFIPDKHFVNPQLLITTDTAQGSSLPHILHYHPSSLRTEKIKISTRPLHLIGLIFCSLDESKSNIWAYPKIPCPSEERDIHPDKGQDAPWGLV